MVENSSSGEAWPVSASEYHDEFLELCALATTDLLTSEERSRLDAHLPGCPVCREALAQYQDLVDVGLPAAAVAPAESVDARSVEESEAAFFARLEREEQHGLAEEEEAEAEAESRPAAPRDRAGVPAGLVDSLWQQLWWHYATAAVLIALLVFSVYRSGLRRGRDIALSGIPTSPPASRLAADLHPAAPNIQVQPTAEAKRDQDAEGQIRRELRNRETELAALERRASQQERNVRASEMERGQLRHNVTDLRRQLAATRTELESAQGRLDVTASQNAADTVRMLALEKQIEDLKTDLTAREQEIAREQELLSHDRDIRELMGSRDLYIAEVYDVAKNGQTQKPFGRVFYTKGKSLVFYAYDLDQQPGIRAADTFQAWGSRGPDRADAVSLGIFYQDNASNKCWILKAENPKALFGIDAVFVTVEPHGGSSHPSGKPLLFAYLHTQPNHP